MKIIYKTALSFLVICTLFYSFAFIARDFSRADELTDLNNQIKAAEQKKQDTLKKIRDIESKIKSLSSTTNNLNSLLASLKAEKTELATQVSTLQTQVADQDKSLTELSAKLKEKNALIQDRINYLYKLSYNRPNSFLSSNGDIKEYFDSKVELDFSIELNKLEIKDYYEKIESTKAIKEQSQKDLQAALDSIKALDDQIASVTEQIAANNRAIAAANQNKSNLVSLSNELNNQLRFLSSQQQALLDAELKKINANQQANQNALQNGQYYFLGRGRDLIEGHGLGMSQWGAYGMASQGWTYDKILTFYYTGTNIGDYTEPQRITVTGKESAYPPEAQARGYLTIDEYLAGIGEVPNSWPAEAVKAQVVAARTYVMGTCGNNVACTICGTASCQVYNGGLGKKPFVDQTKGKVILYQGAPIVAYYSASHRGKSSSVCGVWSTFRADGTSTCNFSSHPYIKPVNDDPYAAKGYTSTNPYNTSQKIQTYNWTWRTNGYSLDELTNIFSRDSRLNVGKVTNIEIMKESEVIPNGSNRVYRIKLQGTSGVKYLSGWNFRSIFNAATPYNDYIYSTEFNFYQFKN